MREPRIALYSLDGRRVYDWRAHDHEAIFIAAIRPGSVSRAVFRIRNEDVGPLGDLRASSTSRLVTIREMPRSLAMGFEGTLVFDLALPSDFAGESPDTVNIIFEGEVTGFL